MKPRDLHEVAMDIDRKVNAGREMSQPRRARRCAQELAKLVGLWPAYRRQHSPHMRLLRSLFAEGWKSELKREGAETRGKGRRATVKARQRVLAGQTFLSDEYGRMLDDLLDTVFTAPRMPQRSVRKGDAGYFRAVSATLLAQIEGDTENMELANRLARLTEPWPGVELGDLLRSKRIADWQVLGLPAAPRIVKKVI